jgi:hypothetical protein
VLTVPRVRFWAQAAVGTSPSRPAPSTSKSDVGDMRKSTSVSPKLYVPARRRRGLTGPRRTLCARSGRTQTAVS